MVSVEIPSSVQSHVESSYFLYKHKNKKHKKSSDVKTRQRNSNPLPQILQTKIVFLQDSKWLHKSESSAFTHQIVMIIPTEFNM